MVMIQLQNYVVILKVKKIRCEVLQQKKEVKIYQKKLLRWKIKSHLDVFFYFFAFCLLLSLYYLYGQKCKSYSFTSFIKWNLYSWCIKFICKLLVSFFILTLFIFFMCSTYYRATQFLFTSELQTQNWMILSEQNIFIKNKLMIKGHLILLFLFFKILFFLIIINVWFYFNVNF